LLNLQQAGSTADPAYYPKADGTLARSLQLRPDATPDGLGGLAALRLAQHCFAESRELAERALPSRRGASRCGAPSPTQTQLGRYAEADDAVRHMLDLGAGVPAHIRAGYGYELLAAALPTNPYFSPRPAPIAPVTLATLGGPG
jgi:hypothetical protein